MNGIIRVPRVDRIAENHVAPESTQVACSNCGSLCWIWNRSRAIAPDLKPTCDVCLPAEPVGPIGAP